MSLNLVTWNHGTIVVAADSRMSLNCTRFVGTPFTIATDNEQKLFVTAAGLVVAYAGRAALGGHLVSALLSDFTTNRGSDIVIPSLLIEQFRRFVEGRVAQEARELDGVFLLCAARSAGQSLVCRWWNRRLSTFSTSFGFIASRYGLPDIVLKARVACGMLPHAATAEYASRHLHDRACGPPLDVVEICDTSTEWLHRKPETHRVRTVAEWLEAASQNRFVWTTSDRELRISTPKPVLRSTLPLGRRPNTRDLRGQSWLR
jgi:hypothetical protein